MRVLEVKNNDCVKDIIANNLELFFRLDLIGVKNINTAIDYLSIYETYQNHSWIEKISDREKVVAERCKVNVKSVRRARFLMEQKIDIEKNPTKL
jgi:hypothetical protein